MGESVPKVGLTHLRGDQMRLEAELIEQPTKRRVQLEANAA